MGRDGRYDRSALCELSSLLTVKTLTGMTTDVYPRENCLDFVFCFFLPNLRDRSLSARLSRNTLMTAPRNLLRTNSTY